MSDIHSRLLRVEDELLDGFSKHSLHDFQRNWSQISDEIATAAQREQLSQNTQILAHTIATRVNNIATAFFDLSTKSQELMIPFMQKVEEILDKEHHIPDRPSLPAYIPLAYGWLLDNLHCPYPPTSIRDSLAQKSSSPRRSIDGWFVDVRKRIGWNRLRRTRFSGKKEDIIRAATLFSHGDVIDEALASEFASIETTAKELYTDKICLTSLGSRNFGISPSVNSHRKSQEPSNNTYPSPDSCSRSQSPSPVLPQVPAKRPRATNEDDLPQGNTDTQSCKKQRLISRLPSSLSPSGTPNFKRSNLELTCRQQSPRTDHLLSSSSQVSGPDITCLTEEACASVEARSSPLFSATQPPLSLSGHSEPESTDQSASPDQQLCIPDPKMHPPLPQDNFSPGCSAPYPSAASCYEWTWDPTSLQSSQDLTGFDNLATCELATFDFSTYLPQNSPQTQESVPTPDLEAVFTLHEANNAGLNGRSSSTTLELSHSMRETPEDLLTLFDFLSPNSPPVAMHDLLPKIVQDHDELVDLPPDLNEPFDWSTSGNVLDLLGPLIRNPSIFELNPPLGVLNDEKTRKLKLLRELKEATHQLEAELAVMW